MFLLSLGRLVDRNADSHIEGFSIKFFSWQLTWSLDQQYILSKFKESNSPDHN